VGRAMAACLWGVASFFFCLVVAVVSSGIESYTDPESNLGATVVWGTICTVLGFVCWFAVGGS